jgi:Xaa-Pro aminopeptidase
MTELKEKLIYAENIALALFSEIENRQLIVAGKDEETLNEEIFQLAKELFNIEKHWHKRIVRSGENTLHPYKINPPNRVFKEDDILFFDFGPIIEKWEADLGRTYVIGANPLKHKLKNDLEKAWQETKDWVDSHNALSASKLFTFAANKAKEYGWEFGGELAGHLIGEFPHEKLEPENYRLYVHPENDTNLFALDEKGNERHWILEMHFIDKVNKIGGFYEQLLL